MITSIIVIVRTVREMMIATTMAIVTLDEPLSLVEVIIGTAVSVRLLGAGTVK